MICKVEQYFPRSSTTFTISSGQIAASRMARRLYGAVMDFRPVVSTRQMEVLELKRSPAQQAQHCGQHNALSGPGVSAFAQSYKLNNYFCITFTFFCVILVK